MSTGADDLITGGDAVRWKPIGSWDRGGTWAYRTARDGRFFPAFLFMVFLVAIGAQDDVERFGELSTTTTAEIALLTFFLCLAVATFRSCTEVDARGITVVNGLRTHRVRWSDVDLVQLDGRPAITLLTKDRRITCWALNQRVGDLIPWSRLERRQALEATAGWMRQMKISEHSNV
jgi:hypothetical protein